MIRPNRQRSIWERQPWANPNERRHSTPNPGTILCRPPSGFRHERSTVFELTVGTGAGLCVR